MIHIENKVNGQGLSFVAPGGLYRYLTGVTDRFPLLCMDLPSQTLSIHPQRLKRELNRLSCSSWSRTSIPTLFFPPYVSFFYQGESPDNLIAGVAEVEELLRPRGFAVSDEFTIVDAALAPFLSHADLFLCNDIGRYAGGMGPRVHETLSSFDSVSVSHSRAEWSGCADSNLIGVLAKQCKGRDEPIE